MCPGPGCLLCINSELLLFGPKAIEAFWHHMKDSDFVKQHPVLSDPVPSLEVCLVCLLGA